MGKEMIKKLQVLCVSNAKEFSKTLNKVISCGASIVDFQDDFDNDTAYLTVLIPDLFVWRKILDIDDPDYSIFMEE